MPMIKGGIDELLRRTKLTRDQLSRALSIDRETIAAFQSGKVTPGHNELGSILDLAYYLGLTGVILTLWHPPQGDWKPNLPNAKPRKPSRHDLLVMLIDQVKLDDPALFGQIGELPKGRKIGRRHQTLHEIEGGRND